MRRLSEQVSLAEATGDTRRATRLKNLTRAQEARIERLRRAWQLREQQIEAQRVTAPEESDVGCLFLQVDGESPQEEARA